MELHKDKQQQQDVKVLSTTRTIHSLPSDHLRLRLESRFTFFTCFKFSPGYL